MSENRECTQFLGVHIAERVLYNVFENVEMQPWGNPGFDFICNKGKKIDVKSSCIRQKKWGKHSWRFNICENKIANYFLCLAFDNRKDLNPLYIWLLPSEEFNNFASIGISITTLQKWDKYALDIDKISMCCDVMKGESA